MSFLPGDAGLVAKRKNEWVVSHPEKEEEDTVEQSLPKDVTTSKAKGGQTTATRKRKRKDVKVL